MASFKFLLDHDVRHLAASFPAKQTVQLEDIGLKADASDSRIVAAASESRYILVTNNARDFEKYVPNHIGATSKKKMGCKQVHGLVIVLPPEQLLQDPAIASASKQMEFEGRIVGWKEVKNCASRWLSTSPASLPLRNYRAARTVSFPMRNNQAFLCIRPADPQSDNMPISARMGGHL